MGLPMAETVNYLTADTDGRRPRAPVLPPDVLADHVFLESLGSSPHFDLWKVRTPKGQLRVVKLLYGLGNPTPKLKENAQCFPSLHHPALLATEVVSVEPGRLVLVTDLAHETLRDRFLKCQSQRLPGIRRIDLIDYVRAAAEVLDYMYQQHGIQHLGLSPRCLVLDNGWLQIADFGLAQLLLHSAGENVAQRNARYAAPELFNKKIVRSSDQVSLALVYAEMLTGIHPWHGGRRLPPDLATLPPLDREVITRALAAAPDERWPNCTDMVLALEGTASTEEKGPPEKTDRFVGLVQQPRSGLPAPVHDPSHANLRRVIADIIAAAGGEVTPQSLDEVPELSADGTVLAHKFQAGLPLGAAKEKLASFHKQCFGDRPSEDDNGCLIHIPLATSFWSKWTGRQAALEVDIRLRRASPTSATPIEVAVTMRTAHCGAKHGRKVLEESGPGILENLRQVLLVNSNKRTQGRLAWPHPVRIIPLLPNGERAAAVDCRGKDISQGGLGFYLPDELDTTDVLIELPNSAHADVSIPATLVRAKKCADGWYDVGALFRLPAVRKSAAEMCLK
jgi:serine/threonine protein kinase